MVIENQSLTVSKSNTLIDASYHLTLNEQRLILACIAQIDSRKGRLPRDNVFTLYAEEFAGIFGITVDQAYESLHDASESLYERDIRTLEGGRHKTRFRWVYYVQYRDGEGCVKLGFSPNVGPHLVGLRKRFTSYQLQALASVRTAYAIRLFEMLMQFQDTGLLRISVADFKERLRLEGKYPRFSDLKRRVIDPSVKELRERSNLLLEWSAIRKGRAVATLEFRFNEDPQGRLDLESPTTGKEAKRMSQKEMAKLARPGETWHQLKARLSQDGD